jgi:ABC-type transporter Mla maintaining outer membrane lipid asymmetry ATPase subunit MlaF
MELVELKLLRDLLVYQSSACHALQTVVRCPRQVMELVELKPLRNSLVGMPGSTGLSVEQRKRLTIAVELVANPSIIFMDEPTTGAVSIPSPSSVPCKTLNAQCRCQMVSAGISDMDGYPLSDRDSAKCTMCPL